MSRAFHADPLGSTRGMTDGTQTVTDSRERDAYGLTIGTSGTTATPFGFVGGQGHQSDYDSGLMLLGARYYDPSVGRFISRDPIGYEGGLNLYAFCGNDPINAIDPEGLAARDERGDPGPGYIRIIVDPSPHGQGGHARIYLPRVGDGGYDDGGRWWGFYMNDPTQGGSSPGGSSAGVGPGYVRLGDNPPPLENYKWWENARVNDIRVDNLDIAAMWKEALKTPKRGYDLRDYNCADWISQVLKAGGVDTDPISIGTPKDLIKIINDR